MNLHCTVVVPHEPGNQISFPRPCPKSSQGLIKSLTPGLKEQYMNDSLPESPIPIGIRPFISTSEFQLRLQISLSHSFLTQTKVYTWKTARSPQDGKEEQGQDFLVLSSKAERQRKAEVLLSCENSSCIRETVITIWGGEHHKL